MTVLSPCILPVLPIILSSGIGGGASTGEVATDRCCDRIRFEFTLFTLFLSAIVNAIGVSA